MLMFSGGFLEMAFGILRCASILTVSRSYYFEFQSPFTLFYYFRPYRGVTHHFECSLTLWPEG